MIRALARLALALWAAFTMAAALWALSHHPFATPFIERGTAEVSAALTRAMARDVTPEWLTPRLAAATAEDNVDQITLLLDLADEHAVPLAPDLRAAAKAKVAEHDGVWSTAKDCAACMADVSSCRSLSLIGFCAIPFELSPAGDVHELWRQGENWISGEEVDELSAALAAVGLAATVVSLPSLGSSVPVKLGASTLRVARRVDALSPGMTRALRTAAREGGSGARLTAIATDVTRIAGATSPAEVLPILRLADNTDELARLARLSEAAGKDTRKSLAVLGKARSLRMLHRLSDLMVATIGLTLAIAAQIGALIGAGLKMMLRQSLRVKPVHPLSRGRIAR